MLRRDSTLERAAGVVDVIQVVDANDEDAVTALTASSTATASTATTSSSRTAAVAATSYAGNGASRIVCVDDDSDDDNADCSSLTVEAFARRIERKASTLPFATCCEIASMYAGDHVLAFKFAAELAASGDGVATLHHVVLESWRALSALLRRHANDDDGGVEAILRIDLNWLRTQMNHLLVDVNPRCTCSFHRLNFEIND